MNRLIYILSCLLFVPLIWAQTAVSYYSCDFEDATENARWVLNTPADPYEFPNKWVIGEAEAYEGTHSLYISTDGGQTAGYTKYDNIQIARRKLLLEAGSYDVAIDWKALGGSTAYLMVAWVRGNNVQKIWNEHNGDAAAFSWLKESRLTFVDAAANLNGSSFWQHATAPFVSDGTEGELVIIWATMSSSSVKNPGACVDNIQIARNKCGRPQNLTPEVKGNVVTLNWESSGELFNLRYHLLGEKTTHTISNIAQTSYTLSLPHGVYVFYIQVKCGDDVSVWYSFPVTIVYDSKCFNYLELNNTNCSYAMTTAPDYTQNVYTQGKVDHGYRSGYSYHTIHYMQGEVDARTYGSNDGKGNSVAPLRTVPDGELASVRINGWQGDPNNARVARIEYNFTVDVEEASAIMLKYAVVLQVPNHQEPAQPRFTLDILDADTGKPLSKCTTVDFAATKENALKEGWYFSPAAELDSVIWKDWTTVGLNLNEYDKTNVRVILTAYGCTASVHYGYAYFTLSCTSGAIEGIQCGNNPTEQFIAPEGFNYHWYKTSSPAETLPNHDQRIFPVAYDDTTHYSVDVIYKTNSQCGFTLSACAIPRFPVPEAEYTLLTKDCKNYIRFKNHSHIRTKIIKDDRYIDTDTPPDYVMWDFGDFASPQSVWEPEIELPDKGGDVTVNLTAVVGLCDSTQTFTIHVPAVGDTVVDEYIQRCKGDVYNYNNRMILSDTTITVERKTRYGCDSMHNYIIKFVDRIELLVDTTLVEGDTLLFAGQSLTQTGNYSHTFVSSMGCDSVVTVKLTVLPQLRVSVPKPDYPCADDEFLSLKYTVISGTADSCFVRFASDAIDAGFEDRRVAISASEGTLLLPLPADVPGWYEMTLTFVSKENGEVVVPVEFMVRYPSALLSQRWNDLIGISKTNTDFASFQWYRYVGDELVAIEGARDAYLYVEDNLQTGERYAVELVPFGEERGVLSCPLVAQYMQPDEISVAPTSLEQGKALRIVLPAPASVQLVSATGISIGTWQLAEGVSTLTPTVAKGVYVLHILPQTGKAYYTLLQVH